MALLKKKTKNGFGGDDDGKLTIGKLKYAIKNLPDDMEVFIEHVDCMEYKALSHNQFQMREEAIESVDYRFLRGIEAVPLHEKFFITAYIN